LDLNGVYTIDVICFIVYLFPESDQVTSWNLKMTLYTSPCSL